LSRDGLFLWKLRLLMLAIAAVALIGVVILNPSGEWK
jgi:hypothetical protein